MMRLCPSCVALSVPAALLDPWWDFSTCSDCDALQRIRGWRTGDVHVKFMLAAIHENYPEVAAAWQAEQAGRGVGQEPANAAHKVHRNKQTSVYKKPAAARGKLGTQKRAPGVQKKPAAARGKLGAEG